MNSIKKKFTGNRRRQNEDAVTLLARSNESAVGISPML